MSGIFDGQPPRSPGRERPPSAPGPARRRVRAERPGERERMMELRRSDDPGVFRALLAVALVTLGALLVTAILIGIGALIAAALGWRL